MPKQQDEIIKKLKKLPEDKEVEIYNYRVDYHEDYYGGEASFEPFELLEAYEKDDKIYVLGMDYVTFNNEDLETYKKEKRKFLNQLGIEVE